ncbi:hypothetical protein KFL_008820020 [Klebsormidium nitens]|uniref:PEBP family protein n=1 Tax=Klebsormidium nitens TaxID=105231 RepID=A0A1Y1ITE1_KLENI|nr:hypothetical protein KFL_008820020 [Klebsormidium nitens]|eukprot:GAQ91917.1 hypothetical protein KFL_008820020 [Klebsormidium nitens]
MAGGTTSAVLAVAIVLLARSVSAQQLVSSVPITPVLQLQAARVIPDVVNGVVSPAENLTIIYGGVNSVGYGNELTVNQTQAAPIVNVINGSDPASLYTLILSDPDVPDPSVAGPNSSYLHYLVVNITGGASSNIAVTGVPLAPYQPPAPPSGLHRYVFQLYKQNATARIGNISVSRSGFLPKTFAATYGLGLPVAVNFFRAQPAGANNLTTNSTPDVVEVQELLRGRVIPQVVPPFTPLARLNVSYGNGTLSYGQIIAPAEATSPPAVYAQGIAPGTIYNSTFPYFTLAVVDPDAPDPTTPTSSLILHYLKVNIPTNTPTANIVNVTGGNVLQTYAPPGPPTGLHRYTFVLYGQGRLSNATAPASRSLFNLTSFALNNTLGSPLAAFYFNSLRVNTTTAAFAPANTNATLVTPTATNATAAKVPAPAPK